MDHVEILMLINKIEQNYPVQSWQSNEISLWPVIRIKLAFLLYNSSRSLSAKDNSPIDSTLSKKGIFRKISDKINWENRSIKHRIDNFAIKQKLKGDDTVAFFTVVANRTLLDGVWYNRSVDPIADLLREKKIRVKILEFKSGMEYKLPRYNNDVCISFEEIFDVNVATKGAAGNNLLLENYENFLVFLKNEVQDVDISSISLSSLSKFVSSFQQYVDYYYRILKESGVKICFTTCYYDPKIMALIHACKKLKIISVELPHGTHGDTHAAFGKWESVPQEGYSVLPDIFWCWSEKERGAIDSWIKRQKCGHQTLLGGNAWLAMWNRSNKLSDKVNKKIKSLNKGFSINILFSVQPFQVFEEAIPPFLMEAIKQSPPDWKWWIRLHPRQPQTVVFFEKAFAEINMHSKINVMEATHFPLPPLLMNMNVHITEYSSVVIEAAEMGVPSIVLSKNGESIFKSLIDAEMLYVAGQTAASVIEGVKFQAKNKMTNPPMNIFDFSILEELIRRAGMSIKK